MGKKKGNSNETEAAKAVTGALEPAVSEEHGEPAASPVVDGDGGEAVDLLAAEQSGEPSPPADGPDDGGADAAEPEGEATAVAAEGLASETAHEGEVSDDAIIEIARQAYSGATGKVGPSCILRPIKLPDAVHDPAVYSAASAAMWAFEFICVTSDTVPHNLHRLEVLGSGDDWSAPYAMARIVRNIGRDRAQPEVIGQQLKIDGILDVAELDAAETVIVNVFADTLASLDAYAKARQEARATAERQPAEPRPVPIDETTMETADDPLATWEA